MKLAELGWNEDFNASAQSFLEQGYDIGRIALEHKGMYRVYTEHREVLAEVSGKMRYAAQGIEDFPSVGDWVILRARYEEGKASIHALLPRRTKFSRKKAGLTTEEQIVAANIDIVFLVNALNQDFNLRRMERYLIMSWESGAKPIIVLSKADLCQDVAEKVSAVESIAFGVPIHVISSHTGAGIDELMTYLQPGITITLLGSSGVGKSTLINQLYGQEIQRVNEVREADDRGKHTTTHREMIILPQGGLIIDTPGMRELQLWESELGLTESFQDIEHLALSCYFTDCQHEHEPRCGIKQAIEDGTLAAERYTNYKKMLRELKYLEHKENVKAQLVQKKGIKKRIQDVKEDMAFRQKKRMKR